MASLWTNDRWDAHRPRQPPGRVPWDPELALSYHRGRRASQPFRKRCAVNTGRLQDLQVLTADTVGIIDAEGTECATCSYQWIRVTDGGSSEITGHASSTYALTSDDVGKSIQLQVAFDDDQEHAESVHSTAPLISSTC